MARKKDLEATQVLKSLESKYLQICAQIKRDPKLYEGIANLLAALSENDQYKILKSVGGADSIDKMIKKTNDQNFWRGRVKAYVLFRAIIERSVEELNRREAKSKKK